MNWIKLLESSSGSTEQWLSVSTSEFFSEVKIPGILNLGKGAVLVGWILVNGQPKIFNYELKIKYPLKLLDLKKISQQLVSPNARKAYYFPGGVVGELLSIFSVYFQARFYLKHTDGGELTTESLKTREAYSIRYFPPRKGINPEMFQSGKRNWVKGVDEFLQKICAIDEKYHQQLALAFYWYSEAIKEIDVNHEMFYIKMVSCIEALLPDIDGSHTDEVEAEMQAFLETANLQGNSKQEIRSWLKNRKIKSRFCSFIEQYSQGFFTGGNRKAKHCYVYKRDLKEYLERIYSARSKYLHQGFPMYISKDALVQPRFFGGSAGWDLDPTQGKGVGGREFKEKEKLPRVRWFERIVNYCLKQYVDTLSKSVKS